MRVRLTMLIVTLVASAIVLGATAESQREVRVKASPSRWYEDKKSLRDKGPLKDYVVEFDVEVQSRAHLVTASGSHENEVLRASSIYTNEVRNGKRIVKVVAGWRARELHSYGGSVDDFARSLRIEYLTPFRPRG